MNEKLEIQQTEERLAPLQMLRARFLGKAMRFREHHASGGFDPMSLLAYAALKRTLFLLDGFIGTVRDRNLVCAGAS